MLSRIYQILSTDFYAPGIHLFHIDKNVDVIFPILIDKDVFEPSYDLKCTV